VDWSSANSVEDSGRKLGGKEETELELEMGGLEEKEEEKEEEEEDEENPVGVVSDSKDWILCRGWLMLEQLDGFGSVRVLSDGAEGWILRPNQDITNWLGTGGRGGGNEIQRKPKTGRLRTGDSKKRDETLSGSESQRLKFQVSLETKKRKKRKLSTISYQ